jgi:molybdenum cofactor synthesis domain-containing protein
MTFDLPRRFDDKRDFVPVRFAVLTVSDTRRRRTTAPATRLSARIEGAGHLLAARALVRDERDQIAAQLRDWIADPQIDAVLSTGGTGLTGRDVTVEAHRDVYEKEIDAFATLFTMVSACRRSAPRRSSRGPAPGSPAAPICLRCPAAPAPAATPGTRSWPRSSTIATALQLRRDHAAPGRASATEMTGGACKPEPPPRALRMTESPPRPDAFPDPQPCGRVPGGAGAGLLGMAANTVRGALQDRAEQAQPPRPARERVFTARVVTVEPGEVAPVAGGLRRGARAPHAGAARADGRGGWSRSPRASRRRRGARRAGADPSRSRRCRGRARPARTDLAAPRPRPATPPAARPGARRTAEAEAQADLRRRAYERRRTLTSAASGPRPRSRRPNWPMPPPVPPSSPARRPRRRPRPVSTTAETALDRQRITLAEAERRLAETEIVAGFDGVLDDVTVVEGGLVSTNERLAQVIDPGAGSRVPAVHRAVPAPAGRFGRLIAALGRGGARPRRARDHLARAADPRRRGGGRGADGPPGLCRHRRAARLSARRFRHRARRRTRAAGRGAASRPRRSMPQAAFWSWARTTGWRPARSRCLRRQGDGCWSARTAWQRARDRGRAHPLLGAGIRIRPSATNLLKPPRPRRWSCWTPRAAPR